jgi:two-component system response regulator RstA
MSDKPRLLLVEDDVRLAGLVREYLEHEGFDVGLEHDGAAAIGRVLAERPDVVVLDYMLPGADGLTVLRGIRAGYDGPVLMLTARRDEVDQILGLEMGADDYVPKPASPRLLLARVRALMRRRAVSQPDDVEEASVVDGDLTLDPSRREVRVAGEVLDLTSAEFDLLQVLLAHRGRPLSRDTLLQKLRGIDYDGVDRSIDVRVSSLRRKLAVSSVQRIKTVRGVGYQFVPAPE